MTLSLGLDFIGMGAFTPASGAALLDGSEADGTQLLPSTDFSGWGSLGGTFTANNTTAPDGTTTAGRFLEDTSTARHGMYSVGGWSFTAGTSHTYSFYVKSITRRYFQLLVSGTGKIYAYFDLQTGTVTNSGVDTGTSVTATSCQAAVNGFYKCSLTGIVDGSSTAPFVHAMCSDVATYGAPLDSNSPSFTGNAANGLYLWRPKVV